MPRASPSGSASPHYVLDYESRFRAEVIEDFADSYRRGETPVPCIRCNETVKFRDLLGDRARSRRRGARDRALCAPRRRAATGPNCTAPATAPATRAISCSRRRAPSSISCAFRWAGWPRTRPARWPGASASPVADKPDSQDICFVPQGSYAAAGRAAAARGGRAGRHRRPRRHACSAAIAASSISPSVSARGSASPRPSRSMCCGSSPSGGASWSGPRAALAETRVSLGELNWLVPQPPPRRASALAVKLRSAQPPVPATLYPGDAARRGRAGSRRAGRRGGAGPGRVLYDGERVLGGGWIRRRTGAAAAAA